MMDDTIQNKEEDEEPNLSIEETATTPIEGNANKDETGSIPLEDTGNEEETEITPVEGTVSKDDIILTPVEGTGDLPKISTDGGEEADAEEVLDEEIESLAETAGHATKKKKKDKKKQIIKQSKGKGKKLKRSARMVEEEDMEETEETVPELKMTGLTETDFEEGDITDQLTEVTGIDEIGGEKEGEIQEEKLDATIGEIPEHVDGHEPEEYSEEKGLKKEESGKEEIGEIKLEGKKGDDSKEEIIKSTSETPEKQKITTVSSEEVPMRKRKSDAAEPYKSDSDAALRGSKQISVDDIRGRKKRRAQRKSISDEEQRRESTQGIFPICLSPETQDILGCVIGENVTTEKPWVQIKRDRIEYIIDTQEHILDFDSIKDEIRELKLDDLWVGYDSANEVPNSFFVCVTESANLYMMQQLKNLEIERKRRVEESLLRPCREWKTLGSEKEIEESRVIDLRTLHQTEHETTIQSLLIEPEFTDLNVEDVVYGYRHILPVEGKFPEQILRSRNEVGIQARKEMASSYTQTELPLPQNNWTQYEQMVFVTEVTDTQILEDMKEFLKNEYPLMNQIIHYNASFDLYEDDYPALILKEADTQPLEQNFQKQYKEYISFTDVLRCKDKYISAIAWHPLWSGIVACAYVDYLRCINIRVDEKETNEILRAVHGSNPVLIWSFVDSLKPKLILECSQEVHALSFCPFNENILTGGCINGQIVVWDLTDKLRKVEEVIHLTPSQQMYREVLFSLISWMKNIRRLEYVSPAAMSSLQYSPARCITSIDWLSPYFEISRIGRYGPLRAHEVTSLQFLTSSEDGAVCIWDLQAPLTKQAVAAKPQRRKKRVLPAALVAEVSRFRYLNNVLMPVFRINIVDPENDTIIPVSTLSSHRIKVNYELKNPKDIHKHTLSERLVYNPVLQDPGNYPEQEFFAGTMEGHILRVVWEGYDTNTGEVINSELGKYPSWGEIHETPITTISTSPFFSNLILTSSAKVFAIWRTDVNNIPLFWRRTRIGMTSCGWSETYPNIFSLLHIDGSIEVWNLLARSNSPIMFQSISGRVLTDYRYSKLGPIQNVIGVADHRGALRVFMDIISEGPLDVSYEIEAMNKLLNREKEKMELFKEWQNEWLNRNKERLQAEQDAIQNELERQEKERQKKEKLEEEKREREEALMRRLQKKQAQTVDIMKQAQEQWEEIQRRGYIKTIMKQRKLDKNEMLVKVEPLNKLKAQEKKKKSKQAEKIQQQDKIFEDTKKLLFPETLMKVQRRDLNVETFREEIEILSTSFMEDYGKIGLNSLEAVSKNPYKYEFGWKDVLTEGMKSQKIVQECINVRSEREERYLKSKTERKLIRLNIEKEAEQQTGKLKSSTVQFGKVTESTVEVINTVPESNISLSRSKLQQRSSSRFPLTSRSSSLNLH